MRTILLTVLVVGLYAAGAADRSDLGDKGVFLALGDELLPLIRDEIDRGRLERGPACEGLVLYAVPLDGGRPAAGECLSFYLVIANQANMPRALYTGRWDLTAIQSGRRVRRLPRRIGLQPEGVRQSDFLVIGPGELAGVLMDARDGRTLEPEAVDQVRLYLEIGVPPDAPARHPEWMFSGRDVLVSGPVGLPEPLLVERLSGDTRRAAEQWRDGGRVHDPVELTTMLPGLLGGLYHDDPAVRSTTFAALASLQDPDHAKALLSCIASWGPRPFPCLAENLLLWLAEQARADRLSVLRRVLDLTPYQRDQHLLLADALQAEDFLPERALAARLYLRHLPGPDEPVQRIPGALGFCAWQCYANPDPALNDPRRAAALMARLVEEAGAAVATTDLLLQAVITDDRQRLAELEAGLHGMDLNNVAWQLTYDAGPERRHAELALRMALRSLDEVDVADRFCVLDTIAAVHACRGDFAQALDYQARAIAVCNLDRNPGYLRRFAKYLLLRHASEPARTAAIADSDSFMGCDPTILLEEDAVRSFVEAAAAEPPVEGTKPTIRALLEGVDPDEVAWNPPRRRRAVALPPPVEVAPGMIPEPPVEALPLHDPTVVEGVIEELDIDIEELDVELPDAEAEPLEPPAE